MSARQLIVLVVAAIAALGALLLIRGMGASHAPAAKTQAVAGEQVLIVTADVAQGAALKPSDLGWRVFPTESVTGNYIRASQQSTATTDFVGAVTLHAFAAGEPVTNTALVMPNGHGFLAAQLPPGFRAVAIKIKPETSAGGYIQPNDRVDVILTVETNRTDGSSIKDVNSDTVLEDVRVLALDDTVQTQTTGDAPTRVPADVVVLELSSEDARVLAQAGAQGNLSLALRGVDVDAANTGAASSSHHARTRERHQGTVLVHSFGTVSGGGGR